MLVYFDLKCFVSFGTDVFMYIYLHRYFILSPCFYMDLTTFFTGAHSAVGGRPQNHIRHKSEINLIKSD